MNNKEKHSQLTPDQPQFNPTALRMAKTIVLAILSAIGLTRKVALEINKYSSSMLSVQEY